MIGRIVEIGLVALVAYWVSGATGIPLWVIALVGAGIYFHQTGGRGLSGGGIGVFGGAMLLVAGIFRLVVANVFFAGLMLVLMQVTGVSNNYAFQEFMRLGWRWWLWPQTNDADLVLWVCVAFIAAWMASEAARGNKKLAGAVFALGAIFIFTTSYKPAQTEQVRPKPTVGTTNDAWQDYDLTSAEDGDVPMYLKMACRKLFGKNIDWCQNGQLAFKGNKNDEPAAVRTVAYTPREVPENMVEQLPDCLLPCAMEIKEIRDLYTDGEPIYALPPGWPLDKAIKYSGKGKMVIEGGSIREGLWSFWHAEDATRADTFVRVFGKK